MPTLNQQLLARALTDPAISGLSDADAAATLSAPVYADFAVATLAAMIDTRALRAPLVIASSNANQQVAGLAIAALGVINANYTTVQMSTPAIATQVLTVLAGLVSAGLFSSADQAAVLSLSQSYRCGGIVATADVTTARAASALSASKATLLTWLATQYQAAIAVCDDGQRAGTLPTKAQLQALFV